ncbi:MAG: hypothetical protein NE328_13390 [Lentisphaeraceae bacterium]|nr:hypothetical protein [Lentisphaeraceae bacterium]
MKIKAPSNRPKTQRELGTSTKTRATQRRGEPQRGGKKNQKKDNTKLFIGIGAGAFCFMFMVCAAVASGGSDRAPVDENTTSSSKKSRFTLPVDVRRQIYADYIAGESKIEDNAQKETKTKNTSIDARQAGANVRAEVKRELQNLRIDLREKWQKKYPGVNSTFIKRVISEGIEKNWSL